MAAGNEPSPPARQTAIASSGPCALAIGAWTRGIFEGRKVIKLVPIGSADRLKAGRGSESSTNEPGSRETPLIPNKKRF
jgi:hypothetical protein